METLLPPSPPAAEGNKLSEKMSQLRYRTIAGSAAEEELVQQHLRLVRSVVSRLALSLPAHVDVEDLYSSGLVGLLNAVRQYAPDGGSSFEAYARVRIRGAVFDELRRLDWVPRSVHEKARKVEKVIHQLEQANGQLPTMQEVARELKMSVRDYESLLDQIRPATFVCLDSASEWEDCNESTRAESIADERQQNPLDSAARRELAALVAEQIERLPDVQRKVLALYYFEDLRLREIAEAFGVTESRICQIHSQAIMAIRCSLEETESAAV